MVSVRKSGEGYKYATSLGDVDILHLEVVQDVGQALECDELASADVLLALYMMSTSVSYQGRYHGTYLDVVVDDLDEAVAARRNSVDDLAERRIREALVHATRVDSAHGVV